MAGKRTMETEIKKLRNKMQLELHFQRTKQKEELMVLKRKLKECVGYLATVERATKIETERKKRHNKMLRLHTETKKQIIENQQKVGTLVEAVQH
jgi:hypothetical protein